MDQQKKENIEKILDKIKALPTLSLVVAKVIQIVSNPLTSASDLSKLITIDQALTAKVLRLANSAFYGFPFRIKNITQAVSILGFDTIRNLALTVSVYKVFTGGEKDGADFSHQEFWKHSVGVAIAANILAKKIKYKSIEGAFTAGLLHDIGKNFFDQYMNKEFKDCIRSAKEKHISIYEAEKQIIGFDHAEIGHMMAEKWNLPPELRAGIGSHHRPEEEKDETVMAHIINVANILCKQANIGFGGDEVVEPISKEGRLLLNLDVVAEEEVLKQMQNELKEAEAFFAIPGA
jgi:putative nucleotidyltransferase with HDIG domain